MRRSARVPGAIPWLLLAASLFVATGCDAGGRGETCGKVTPCGGEVEGEWQVGAACVGSGAALGQLLTSALAAYCPAATVGALALFPAGSLSFRADLTFSASVTVGVSAQVSLPSSCLGGVPCGLASLGLQAWLKQSGLPMDIASASCEGREACACAVVAREPTLDASGTYALAGKSLTLTPGQGAAITTDYCVQEPELHVMSRLGAAAMPAAASSVFAADLVASKLW